MNVEIFSLCDHATDNHGKLTVCGTFDCIHAPQFPVVHAHCSIAGRLRFQRSEEGKHHIRIMLVDGDGRLLIPKFEREIVSRCAEGMDTATANLVLDLNNLPVPSKGTFYWDLVIDGQLVSRLPMYTREISITQQAA
ncbi:MAG: hypothetical protein JNG83_02875 [Opitutaceae bacterium]|nr:hypothetical protein [Opitutaceae bacterium]